MSTPKAALLLAADPTQLASELLTAAHAAGREAWLDRFSAALDRRRASGDLASILSTWGLSRAQFGQLLGVSRQAVAKWLVRGVPGERVVDVADLAAATDLLTHHVKRERIPAVVRRPAPGLGDLSLLDLVAAGECRAVLVACRQMFDWSASQGG